MTYCRLTPATGRTFTCHTCGRSITFRTPRDAATLHLVCTPRAPRPSPAPPGPRRQLSTLVERNTAALLATIRNMREERGQGIGETSGLSPLPSSLSPPWPAIERTARHVCETGAWSGCERARQAWADRVLQMAGKPALWPAEWGEYPKG